MNMAVQLRTPSYRYHLLQPSGKRSGPYPGLEAEAEIRLELPTGPDNAENDRGAWRSNYASEWFLGRLLFVVREDEPTVEIVDLGEQIGDRFENQWDVTDNRRQLAAQLICIVRQDNVQAVARAASYSTSRQVIDELRDLLNASPADVAQYSWKMPTWGQAVSIGYGEEGAFNKEEQPTRVATELPHPNAVYCEYKSVPPHRSRLPHRYTGGWPPPVVLDEIPNWQNALDEEGVPGQDESTIKPAENQRTITDDAEYTAADVVVADGRETPALIELDSGRPERVICFDGQVTREISCVRGDAPIIPVPDASRYLFPIRVVSRLSQNLRNPDDRLRFTLDDHGCVTEDE